jgi:hypothetical protein
MVELDVHEEAIWNGQLRLSRRARRSPRLVTSLAGRDEQGTDPAAPAADGVALDAALLEKRGE